MYWEAWAPKLECLGAWRAPQNFCSGDQLWGLGASTKMLKFSLEHSLATYWMTYGCLIDWPADPTVEGLMNLLNDWWLIDWLNTLLTDSAVQGLTVWIIYTMYGWLIDWTTNSTVRELTLNSLLLVDWLNNWLYCQWLTNWLIGLWMVNWLLDWLIV